MKTPDEAKMGLECCKRISLDCFVCPYAPVNNVDEIVLDCRGAMLEDLSAYIQQLEAERDALLKYLTESHFVPCDICKHDIDGSGTMGCQRIREIKGPCFEWRGVKEDTHEQ